MRQRAAVICTDTPPAGACCNIAVVLVAPFSLVSVLTLPPVRCLKPCSACSRSLVIVFLASVNWAFRSSVLVGMVFEILFATAVTVEVSEAGLYAELTESPRLLASDGRESMEETGPLGVTDVRLDGVTASGDIDCCDGVECLTPLTPDCGVSGVCSGPFGGRKTTRIFFSRIEDLFVCSMWDHCRR